MGVGPLAPPSRPLTVLPLARENHPEGDMQVQEHTQLQALAHKTLTCVPHVSRVSHASHMCMGEGPTQVTQGQGLT